MNRGLIAILTFIICSCSGNENPNEAVDIDDIMGETGREEVIDSSDNLVNVNFDTQLHELSSMLGSEYDTAYLAESHPLDRFGFSTRQKLEFVGKNQVAYGSGRVTPSAEFFYYSFVDSNKTVNAFYNYLDGMAEDGEGGPVKLNVDVESIKMPPMFMLVYDTVIVSAKYQCEHASNDWKSFQDSVLQVYGSDCKYRIDVDCGGPLKWK